MAGILLLAALLPHVLAVLGVPVFHNYSYVSSDGRFEDFESPMKGRDLTMVEASFDRYRGPKQTELILYRTMARTWWRYWEWADYASHPRWSYPYREPVSTEGDSR